MTLGGEHCLLKKKKYKEEAFNTAYSSSSYMGVTRELEFIYANFDFAKSPIVSAN